MSAALVAGCGSSDGEEAALATTGAPFPTALPTPRDLTERVAERAARPRSR